MPDIPGLCYGARAGEAGYKTSPYGDGRIAAARRPGYPFQFLSPPIAGLRDFHFYPLRVLAAGNPGNKIQSSARK
jgi:hypothetical protein